jgi:hypothetical protein
VKTEQASESQVEFSGKILWNFASGDSVIDGPTIVNSIVWVLSCPALFFCATKRARYHKYGSAVLAPVI